MLCEKTLLRTVEDAKIPAADNTSVQMNGKPFPAKQEFKLTSFQILTLPLTSNLDDKTPLLGITYSTQEMRNVSQAPESHIEGGCEAEWSLARL